MDNYREFGCLYSMQEFKGGKNICFLSKFKLRRNGGSGFNNEGMEEYV